MKQDALFDIYNPELDPAYVAPPRIDGATYDPARDGERLGQQLARVFDLMRDGQWRTLAQIAQLVRGSEASVSARLRDYRKPQYGGHIVERRYLHDGVWVYRLDVAAGPETGVTS